MSWQPNQSNLQQVSQLLQHSVGKDNEQRKLAFDQLNRFSESPDFPNCLAYIFAFPSSDTQLRTLAGLHLKNILRTNLNTYNPDNLGYIKSCINQAIIDEDEVVRVTAGSIITTVLSTNLEKWPEILQVLLQYIDHPDPKIVTSTFNTFKKICEDIGGKLDTSLPDFVNILTSKFISKIDDPNPKIRADAIFCVNQFVRIGAHGFGPNVELFVNSLYKTTNDINPDVCMMICRSLVMLLEVYPQALTPEIDNVIKFMIHSNQSNNADVAKEACEFWLAIADTDNFRSILRPYLGQIIPKLMEGMVYSDDDAEVQGLFNNDAHMEDNDTDIKPRFHKARTVQQSHDDKNKSSEENTNNGNNKDDDDDDDDSMFDDDEDEDGDIYSEWNLRKCSAASLDIFSSVFNKEILPFVLPILGEQLARPEWKLKEAAILAFGAIAEGCLDWIMPDLPQLIPFLVDTLRDNNVLVRCITCWTLGRYSIWIVAPPPEYTYENNLQSHHKRFFEPMLSSLLEAVLDDNKRVQEAACSALATLEEEAGSELIPYLEPIIRTLGKAFEKYQSKNTIILYDAVGTLAESVDSALQNDNLVPLLMDPLNKKWESTPDLDSGIFALLECFAAVATALGDRFIPYADVIWKRCLSIIYQIFQQLDLYFSDPNGIDPPDKDFIVVALDLLSGVAQGVESYTENLVPLGSPNIIQLLPSCMTDVYPDVKQSVYALIGDLAIYAFNHLQPFVPNIMPEIVNQISANNIQIISVCNNAAWAAGEIAWRSDNTFEPFIVPLLQKLIPVLCGNNVQRTLVENAAITIARLGKVNPHLVSPYLESFIQQWCLVMKGIRDNNEKASAFIGMLNIISVDPNPIVKQDSEGNYTVFLLFGSSILNWRDIHPDLNNKFYEILNNFKTFLGVNWELALKIWPPHLRDLLQSRYNL